MLTISELLIDCAKKNGLIGGDKLSSENEILENIVSAGIPFIFNLLNRRT